VSTPGNPTDGSAGQPEPRVARRDTDLGRAIDAPTSNVERHEVPKDLPDLDKIHHVGVAGKPAAAAASGAAATATVELEKDAAPSNLHTVSTPPTRATSVRTGQAPLRAAMQLRHIDPWTTFKLSLVVSVVLFFVWMIAVGALYIVLSGMGVWSKINDSMSTLVNEQAGASLVSAGEVFQWAAIVGVSNVILMTALFTVGAFIYNLCAELVGGVQITLGDRD
jgi:hypothetical protein